MNSLKPTIGFEFEDKYLEAKNKLIDLIKALKELTPAQSKELAMELLAAIGIVDSYEALISLLSKGGQQ